MYVIAVSAVPVHVNIDAVDAALGSSTHLKMFYEWSIVDKSIINSMTLRCYECKRLDEWASMIEKSLCCHV